MSDTVANRSQPIVIAKVGSNAITTTLEDSTQCVDQEKIARIAKGISNAREHGYQVILVTSGAVASGMYVENFTKRPGIGEAIRLSSLAAIGQSQLMAVYEKEFSKLKIHIAQGLPSQTDFQHEVVNKHMKETLLDLLSLGVVPIINENDFTSYAEMRFGDNDIIAGLIGILCDAQYLSIFTVQDGIMSANPNRDPNAYLLEVIDGLTPEMFDDSQEKSAAGSGGVNSKLFIGDLCRYSGIQTSISHIDNAASLVDIVEGRTKCTRFKVRDENNMSIYTAGKIVQEQSAPRDNPFFSVERYVQDFRN
ncbi:MAG: glutamate 5-kinase [Acidimicrobiia bacterium]